VGKKSRDKGARGEREVRDVFNRYGYRAKRGCQHKGGPGTPDVELSDVLREVHLESKRSEGLCIYPALDQARRDAGGKIPIVVHRRNGKEWVAILPLELFIERFVLKVFPPDATKEEV
jgi:hypothetical protein